MRNRHRIGLPNPASSIVKVKIRKYASNRKFYATYRMSAAIDRMIVVETVAQKRRAAQWALAWSKVSYAHRRP